MYDPRGFSGGRSTDADRWIHGIACGSVRTTLGSVAVKAALKRAGVDPGRIDEVIFGNVVGAGLGQNVARQVAIGAGLAPSIGATTVNKVCGSGLKSVMLASQAIQCGDSQVVVAGGTENMSQAPYLLLKARTGYRMGNGELVDSMIRDGLWDVYNNLHMGICGDRCAEKCHFSRKDQDDFAVASYKRAIAAQESGILAAEITPVEIADRKGTVTVDRDEELTRFNEEKLRALRPAFGKEGTVTAGNASSINDGAAAIIVLSAEKVRELGVKPQARVPRLHHFLPRAGVVHPGPRQCRGQPPEEARLEGRGRGPVRGQRGVFRSGHGGDEGDQGPAREAERLRRGGRLWPPDRLQRGPRAGDVAQRLAQRKGKIGIASLCIGGGEAVALAVERV